MIMTLTCCTFLNRKHGRCLPNRRKILAIYALTLLMYTVVSPDPNPRGGGELPNRKSAILR